MFDLAHIHDYKMSEEEANAYKIAVLWIELARKAFPRYQHLGLPIRRDPRKSLLFKYAYKLARETKGIIPDDEYSLYIQAQLDILKVMTADQDGPRVEINCLVGDKAWKRWKVWKKYYDKKVKFGPAGTTSINDAAAVKRDLENTRIHLETRFNGIPSEQEYEVRKADVTRWLGTGRISPYYALLSPWAKKYINFKELSLDLGVFQKDITPEIEAQFCSFIPTRRLVTFLGFEAIITIFCHLLQLNQEVIVGKGHHRLGVVGEATHLS